LNVEDATYWKDREADSSSDNTYNAVYAATLPYAWAKHCQWSYEIWQDVAGTDAKYEGTDL